MLQPNLKAVTPLDDHKLLLLYETGEEKVFDVLPYIGDGWYGELRDKSYFMRVRMLEDGYGIEWPHGQDIAPHELYEGRENGICNERGMPIEEFAAQLGLTEILEEDKRRDT